MSFFFYAKNKQGEYLYWNCGYKGNKFKNIKINDDHGNYICDEMACPDCGAHEEFGLTETMIL